MTILLTTLLSLILLTAGPSYAEWALVEYTRASFHPPAVTPLGAYQKASACLAALRAQHRINAEGAQYAQNALRADSENIDPFLRDQLVAR